MLRTLQYGAVHLLCHTILASSSLDPPPGTKIIVFGSAGNLNDFQVSQIKRHKKVIYLFVPVKPVFFFEANSNNSLTLLLC